MVWTRALEDDPMGVALRVRVNGGWMMLPSLKYGDPNSVSPSFARVCRKEGATAPHHKEFMRTLDALAYILLHCAAIGSEIMPALEKLEIFF